MATPDNGEPKIGRAKVEILRALAANRSLYFDAERRRYRWIGYRDRVDHRTVRWLADYGYVALTEHERGHDVRLSDAGRALVREMRRDWADA